jgi:hypothetical protein
LDNFEENRSKGVQKRILEGKSNVFFEFIYLTENKITFEETLNI